MGPRVLRQRKKKELTPEERLQRMKGLSKAFVKENTGWSKVTPVYQADSSDEDSSASGDEDDNTEELRNNDPDDDDDEKKKRRRRTMEIL
jgi:hypothetical protein